MNANRCAFIYVPPSHSGPGSAASIYSLSKGRKGRTKSLTSQLRRCKQSLLYWMTFADGWREGQSQEVKSVNKSVSANLIYVTSSMKDKNIKDY